MGLTDTELRDVLGLARGFAQEVLLARSMDTWRRDPAVARLPLAPWLDAPEFQLGPRGLSLSLPGAEAMEVSWVTLWRAWTDLRSAREGPALDLSLREERLAVELTGALAHLTLRLAPAVTRYARGRAELVQEPLQGPEARALERSAASMAVQSWEVLAPRGPEAFRSLLGDPPREVLALGGLKGTALAVQPSPGGGAVVLSVEALGFWFRCLVAALTRVPDLASRLAGARALRLRLAARHGHPVDDDGWPTPGAVFATAGRMKALWLGRSQGAGLVLQVPRYTVREYHSGRDVSFPPSKLLLAMTRWPSQNLADAVVTATTGHDHFFVSDDRVGALEGEEVAGVCLGSSGSLLASLLTQGLGDASAEVRQVALLAHAERTLRRGYFKENTSAIYAGGRRIVARSKLGVRAP
ncbi:MAG: hypothetical protein HY909_27870 [Deltaproteobacteria bacterium]|nr:hypothetical protein [Deltaproteobacteria bacterium]